MEGGIIERKQRIYPEMPERGDKEYLRMLAERLGRTRLGSDRGHRG
jgi:hypothetical protein